MALIGGLAFLATACDDRVATSKPEPAKMTRDAIGYYCHMIIADHPGPKAQIFVRGTVEPVWFSSVRDAVAFTMLPEEPKTIAAIYVNDAAALGEWENPVPSQWISADQAVFVVGSSRRGGMGAPEIVPFSNQADADQFIARFGGEISAWDAIPKQLVLGPVDALMAGDAEAPHTKTMMGGMDHHSGMPENKHME